MKNVTKKELINYVTKITDLEREESEVAISAFLQGIEYFTKQEERNIQIRGFGSFNIITRKAKKGRIITRNEVIDIPEKKVVKFRPSFTI